MTDEQQSIVPALTDVGHVRIRPSMYLRGNDQRALHEVIKLLLDFAGNLALADACTELEITLFGSNSIRYIDNGHGIPTEILASKGQSILDLAFTQHYMEFARWQAFYLLGIHGLTIVNATSDSLSVEMRREGYLWKVHYLCGVLQGEVTRVRTLSPDERTGLTIIFTPDFTVFEPNDFDYDIVSHFCRLYASTIPNFKIELKDQRTSYTPQSETFFYPDGLLAYLNYLNRDLSVLHQAIRVREKIELPPKSPSHTPTYMMVEIALQYLHSSQTRVVSYVNGFIAAGGTHMDGLLIGLGNHLYHYAQRHSLETLSPNSFKSSDLTNGLTTVVSVWHPEPKYASATRRVIAVPELRDAVSCLVEEALTAFAATHPDELQTIVNKCLKNRQLRKFRMQRRYKGDSQ